MCVVILSFYSLFRSSLAASDGAAVLGVHTQQHLYKIRNEHYIHNVQYIFDFVHYLAYMSTESRREAGFVDSGQKII